MTTSVTTNTTGVGLDLRRSDSPIVGYTSLDRVSIANDLRVFAKTQFHDRWTNFNETEFAVVFLELLAYIGDLVLYHTNTSFSEADPLTCTVRDTFIKLAASYDFYLKGPVGSSASVTLYSDVNALPYALDSATFKLGSSTGNVFMLTADVVITSAEQEVEMRSGELVVNSLLGVSTGLPSQQYIVQPSSNTSPLLYEYRAGEGVVPTLTVRVGGATWTRARLAADAQSTDEVYFLRVDETDTVRVYFGDGINGRIPPNGVDIRFDGRFGSTNAANDNARTINQIKTPIPGLREVTNKSSASNGQLRQSLNSGKAALPAAISANNRAVVASDFANVLFSSNAPAGIAKASATSAGSFNSQAVWLVPAGGGPLTDTLRNQVSAFMHTVKILGQKVLILDRSDVRVKVCVDLYVAKNYRPEDVVSRFRSLLVTESTDHIYGNAAFDFNSLGLGGRDDSGAPQLTVQAISQLADSMRTTGLQKAVIRELRTLPVGKPLLNNVNNGNGGISGVSYLVPQNVSRREFKVVFQSNIYFKVYRRIVGTSTFLTDDRLIDDRLDLADILEGAIPPTAVLNPDRYQELSFPVIGTTNNQIITDSSTGSVFGNASVGDDYYLELYDGAGYLPGAVSVSYTYTSSFGDVALQIFAGSTAFSAGDTLLVDVFPFVGDISLRPDEHPVFTRDTSGVAVDVTTTVRTEV